MFPSFCAAMGGTGWLVMILVWGGLIAVVVWGIARLFPDRDEAAVPTPPPQREGEEDAVAPLTEYDRR